MFVTNLLLSSQWLDGGEAEDEDVAEEEEEDGVDQGDDPKALKLHLTIHCLYRNSFFFFFSPQFAQRKQFVNFSVFFIILYIKNVPH